MDTWRDIMAGRGAVAAFLSLGLVWGAFAALVPPIKAQAGLGDAGFGLALLVASCGAVLAMWLAPWAESRLGRAALPLAAIAMAAAFLLPGLARSWAGFAAAMLAAAVASGTLDVAMNARVAALEAERRRPFMNLAHALYSLAYAGAALAAGLMRAAGLGPVAVFAVMSGAIGLLCAVMLRAPAAAPVDTQEGPAPRLPWALLLPGGALVLLAFMSEQATENWAALHLERNLGADAALGALGPAILGLTMGAGRLAGQMAAHRLPEVALLRAGAVLAASGAGLAALAPSLGMAYAGFAALGLGLSVLAPTALALAGRCVPPAQRAVAIARVSVLGYAGFFIGPPVMGFLAQAHGLPAAFGAVAAALLLIPVVLVPLLARRSAPR